MRIGLCSSDFKKPMKCDDLFKKMADLKFPVTQVGLASVIETDFVPTGNIEIPWKVEDDVIRLLINTSEKYGIEIISVNGTCNMAHPDKKIRDEAVARFDGFAKSCRAMGATYASLCSGTRDLYDLWTYNENNDSEDAWNDMFDTMKRFVDIAEKYGLILAVETEAANVINTPERARKLMDDVGSDNLKMIIDCANLFHRGKAHKENVRPTLKHAFECFGKDIVMAHGKDISDSDGIDYCPTGEGIIDYPYFMELLKEYNYSGDMLLHSIVFEEKMITGRKIIENLL